MKKRVNKEDRELIVEIVERAVKTYGKRIKSATLTKALIAAHRANPIRLNDLLLTCYVDFYLDVLAGAYRHYDPDTDSIEDNWKAQHSK